MSNGEICSTGGIRIHNPDRPSEMIYFPEGDAQKELLESVDPELRSEVEAMMEAGGVYNVYVGGESTPEGEALSVTVKDPYGGEIKSPLIFGSLIPLVDKSGGVIESFWCDALPFAIFATGVNGILFGVNNKTVKTWGGIVGSGALAFTIVSAVKCFRAPPTPPSPPGGGSWRHPESRGTERLQPPMGRTQLAPEPLWYLIPAAALGAFLYVIGGGSMGLQPAGGLPLTLNGQAGAEIY